MNFNKIRRIVSGKKARFVTEDGSELDLCYVTDRILICGWPASGVESLYRNDRSVVRKFLSTRYDTNYRIFNFVPRVENSYDINYFNDQVSRFPFPDHHPPPLSMIPLVTKSMREYLKQDEKNVIVIHCKAGKGRSGTMACCYLLSLPSLPQPPQKAQNYSKGKRPELSTPPSRPASSLQSPIDTDSDEDAGVPPRSQSGGAALDLAGFRGEQRHKVGRERIQRLVENLTSDDEAGAEQGLEEEAVLDTEDNDAGTADREVLGMADKLDRIFELHTAQRMKPPKPSLNAHDTSTNAPDSTNSAPSPSSTKFKKPVRGVSIPSQRRVVGYWSRILVKQDPRPLDLLAPPNPSRLERVRRQVSIQAIRIYMPDKMPGLPAPASKKAVSVHLGRYRTSLVDGLERKEMALREMRRAEKKLRKSSLTAEERANEQDKLDKLDKEWREWKDDDWEDTTDMFEREGSLVEPRKNMHNTAVVNMPGNDASDEDSESVDGVRRLFPSKHTPAGSILVDADRELQMKILIGDTGKTHARLPDVGSLGYAWIIPSFEAKLSPTLDEDSSLHFTVSLDRSELDFFKPQSGITKMEIDLVWTVY